MLEVTEVHFTSVTEEGFEEADMRLCDGSPLKRQPCELLKPRHMKGTYAL